VLRALVLLVFSGCAWAQQAGEPVRVVTDSWPPFRMQGAGGQLEGPDIDLLDELQRRSGLRFEVRLQPWARALADMRRRPGLPLNWL
jgi:polar amino acid transport system substrate-binding protein